MIEIGGERLTLKKIEAVLFNDEKIELNKAAYDEIVQSHRFLTEFARNKVIYGINTGFGPMAQYKIDEKDQEQLQYNLIRSHSAGSGRRLFPEEVKALMLARLNTLMLGYSGVHEETVELLRDLINAYITPEIFEHGGVGASGDLVQLAHLALFMIGEGYGFYQGKRKPADEIFKEVGLKPLKIHLREGLAIMNGTAAMTGIGVHNLLSAHRLIHWSVLASAMVNEIVEAFDDHLSKELNYTKLHAGQREIADMILRVLSGSKRIKRRNDHLYNKQIEEEVMLEKVQEYYSLRCVPQILGPVFDTIANAEKILVDEINSANDNPIIDRKNNNVFHGGNFHGDYIGLEMDKLKIALTKMSMLIERQLNYILNDKLNNKLPPFINLGKLGFNFGIQGMQFVAVSTTAENQSLCFPMYIHSIPNNNDNQDIVSMGANASLICKKVIKNNFEIMAIYFIALIQAVDYLKIKDDLSQTSRKYYEEFRKLVPLFRDDQPKSSEIAAVKEYLNNTRPDFQA